MLQGLRFLVGRMQLFAMRELGLQGCFQARLQLAVGNVVLAQTVKQTGKHEAGKPDNCPD